METRKLYEEDSHKKSFTAKVLKCIEIEGKKEYWVILDQTVFFPEGGGQAADIGKLDGICVEDVQERDGIIYHKIKEKIEEGKEITGEIDFEERFDRMQNHSGEHIVSGLVHTYFGYANVGFHMGKETVTMDFNGELTREDLERLEREANRAVIQNLPVLVSFPDKKELEKLEYRSKIEIKGQVRIVEIPGYDKCACCAPHVRHTGEIGIIKLLSGQKYKGGTRVSMLCGFRALEDYNRKAENVEAVSILLSAKQIEIKEAVIRLKEENIHEKGRISNLRQQIFTYKIKEIPEEKQRICLFEKELSANEMRWLVNMALEKAKEFCIVLVENKEGYQYIAGSKIIDIREFGKELQEKFQGRGGGKKEMIQGSIKGEEKEIQKFIENYCL